MRLILLLSLLTCTLLNFNAQVNLTSSLTACYSLNGNANEPVSSLNGTLTGVTSTSDRFNNGGSALSFSGTASSVVLLPNSTLIKPANAVSVSGWYKVSSFINNALVVFTKNNWGSYFTAYALAVQNSGGYKFAAYRQNGSGSDFVQGSTSISTNTWYHVVFTIDNSNMRIYINGQLENTISNTISSFNYDSNTGVILGGSNESNYNVPFAGCIDNLRFYSRVINSSEVSALYTQDPSCNSIPATSFSLSSTSICVGSSVTATDLSSDSPTSWNWQTPGAGSSSSSTNNPIITYQFPGTYSISLTASNGFGTGNTVTQTISVLPSPTVAISSKTIFCYGQSATLTASGASTYTWNNSQTGQNIVINPTQSVTYTVQGTTSTGCFGSAQKLVIVVPLPTLSISGSDVCSGGSTTLFAGGASTYTWNTNATGNTISINPPGTSNYVVTGTDNYGCVGSALKQVIVHPLPQVTITGNPAVCAGSPISLTASGSALTYSWSNGFFGNVLSVSPVTSTAYAVTGFDSNGCTKTVSKNIVVYQLPVVSANASKTTVCSGESVILTGSGASTYLWSGGITNNVAFIPATTMVYLVTGTNANNCKGTSTVQVVVNPLPVLNISSSNPVMCPGESASLTVTGADSYTWNTGDATSVIVVNPGTTTGYTVSGIDVNGCKSSSVFLQSVGCTGISSVGSTIKVEIYPNPFNNEIIINSETSEGLILEFYNVPGEKLIETKTENLSTNLDLHDFAPGLYFVKIYDADHKLVRQEKLIKRSE